MTVAMKMEYSEDLNEVRITRAPMITVLAIPYIIIMEQIGSNRHSSIHKSELFDTLRAKSFKTEQNNSYLRNSNLT